MSPPRILALDWGTTNLRACLLGDDGRALETRQGPGGILSVRDGLFEQALMALARDWIATHRCPLLASGMIGSRQGWREAPYLECPATLEAAAARLTRVDLEGGATLHIVPGLTCTGDDGELDVMRGEETQLWGAGLEAATTAVLPGTHSKWVSLGEGGRIDAFRTYMTGELYALLTEHGILGRLMAFGQASPAAFERGVRLGLAGHADATHVIFAARTAGLAGRLQGAELPDFLSGQLIGIEIGSAMRHAPARAVAVLGAAQLADRYATALRIAGIEPRLESPDTAMRGLWRVALAAGLVRSPA